MKLSKQNEECQIWWIFHSVSWHLQWHFARLINQLTSKSRVKLNASCSLSFPQIAAATNGVRGEHTIYLDRTRTEPQPKSEPGKNTPLHWGRAYHIFKMIYGEYLARRADGNYATDLVRGARCEVEWSPSQNPSKNWSRWMLKASDSIFW